MIFQKFINYYIFLSFRRRNLDRNLAKYINGLTGRVLDVGGGRKKGYFARPGIKEWIVLDIDPKLKPDVVGDVHNLPFKNGGFDSIKLTEVLEHVEDPKKAISEIARVLRRGGKVIISTPFMYPVHADPYDYQRITDVKLKLFFKENNLKPETFIIEGYFFTILADMLKSLVSTWFVGFRWFAYIFLFPVLELIYYFDKKISQKSKVLSKYHSSYFFVLIKI